MTAAQLDHMAQRLADALGSPSGCDGTLRTARIIFGPDMVPTLQAHGGHCDCEVLFNAVLPLIEAARPTSPKQPYHLDVDDAYLHSFEATDDCAAMDYGQAEARKTGARVAVFRGVIRSGIRPFVVIDPDGHTAR